MFDTKTRKQTWVEKVKAAKFVITNDNKKLILCLKDGRDNFAKYCVRTKKLLNVFSCGIDENTFTFFLDYNDNFMFVGYFCGRIAVYDLRKNKLVYTIQKCFKSCQSFTISKNKLFAYWCDYYGNIFKIIWKPNATCQEDFELVEEKALKGNETSHLCLTDDDKYLIIGLLNDVQVFNVDTWEVVKEHKFGNSIQAISLINNGNHVLIAVQNGDMIVIDTKNFEIIFKELEITKHHQLTKITII